MTVVTDSGCAFTGDLFMNMPIVKDMHYRPILLMDQKELLASWRKLLDAGMKTVYPAHGAPMRRKAIEDALALLAPG